MDKFKKSIITFLSCVLLLCCSLIAACGSTGSDDAGVDEDNRRLNSNDPIIGTWYGEGDSGDDDSVNLIFYLEISYVESSNFAYYAEIHEKCYSYINQREIPTTEECYLYVSTEKTELNDNQYFLRGRLDTLFNGVSKSYFIFTLTDNNNISVSRLDGNEANVETFSRTTMTLDEFNAINVIPDDIAL